MGPDGRLLTPEIKTVEFLIQKLTKKHVKNIILLVNGKLLMKKKSDLVKAFNEWYSQSYPGLNPDDPLYDYSWKHVVRHIEQIALSAYLKANEPYVVE